MKKFLLALAFVWLWSSSAMAQQACAEGSTCVPPEDMAVFVKLLKEKKCLQETKPAFKLDSINLIVDQDGRVYYTGADPKPYTLKMAWCDYDVTGTGKVDLVVAKKEPPTWGFRFRPKFAGSFLFVDGFEQYGPDNKYDPSRAVDVGILWEFIYWHAFNLNVATGFRSVGAGLGVDLTKNFGVYAGYAFSWWTLKHNPQAGIYFSFW